jgi:hypothetical protein
MNTVFKKIILFLGAVIMSAGLYHGALFAGDPITTFADEYTAGGTEAFNLAQWDLSGIAPSANPDFKYAKKSKLVIYYLGSTGESTALGQQSTPEWLKVDGTHVKIETATTEILSKVAVSLKHSSRLEFTVEDQLNYPYLMETADIPSRNTPLWPTGASFYQFYDLSRVSPSLSGYWLGIYLAAIGTTNNFPILPADPSQVSAGTYEEIAFIFGSATTVTTGHPSPEPHIYLILGTLLAGLGLVAYRSRKKA